MNTLARSNNYKSFMIKKAYSQVLDHIVENANEEDGQSDERVDHGNNDSDGGSS
jgi:hypothetical protein